MQEETFQLQKKQVIEYTHRKFIKPLQRKCQSKSQNSDDFYLTLETCLDSNAISNFCKRGSNFSIEEEYHPQFLQNPLVNELPNLDKVQVQLNHTIQQQPEITYIHTDMFKNEHSNLKDSEQKLQNIQNDCDELQEDPIGDDYKLIQVDDINYLQTFQSNVIENQKKASRDKKQTPKILHQDLTKGIHKILIKK
ncbi:unnamed protein product [Paramecium pentaurelia]|uniref:Uncharacterized protein n=1 Tax=Paramecium pentaurelia TaxID=43138 RepID=A0A8S1X0I0_9CILI|nr:unnamed protein product [Paramecium pentaurelia]